MSHAPTLFKICVEAIRNNNLISRLDANDKEFHFQNWFEARLQTSQLAYIVLGRNRYPDFILSEFYEGYEVKGLAYGERVAKQKAKRVADQRSLDLAELTETSNVRMIATTRVNTVDGNSQMPRGKHDEREIFYVFGRYPQKPDGATYPVMDLVLCHGSFLNANNNYVHKNRSFKGFGSYGDILVRDRKMYVLPTPYALADGIKHNRTLILPANMVTPPGLVAVGSLVRKEVGEIVGSYTFDLTSNNLSVTTIPNPDNGLEHEFIVYRMEGDPVDPVCLREREQVLADLDEAEKPGSEDE